MGWGKSDDTAAAVEMPEMQDSSSVTDTSAAVMESMSGMMTGMMGMMSQVMSSSQESLPETPETYSTPAVDWTEQTEQLNNKMRADYNVEEARRKGNQDTVLTSPLLEDEDATVTGSILG